MSVGRARDDSSAIGGVVGGFAPLDGSLLIPDVYLPPSEGGTPDDILDVPTAELDDTLVLAPDGAGGVAWVAGSGASSETAYSPIMASAPNIVTTDGAAVWLPLVTDDGEPVLGVGIGSSALTVEEVDGTPTSLITKLVFPNGTLSVVGGVATYTPAGLYPLDNLTLDATYGDHFTAASLDAKWTRRNFTGSNETFQTPSASWMRLSMTGRTGGDGYFQSVSGDWTFMMKCVARTATMPFWAIAAIDSAGTGIGTFAAASPNGIGLGTITTYTSYGGTYIMQAGVTIAQSVGVKLWQYLRKSGTSYYHAYSFDGEVWSSEVTLTSSATINRIGMMIHPYPWGQGGGTTSSTVDVDLFNKIA